MASPMLAACFCRATCSAGYAFCTAAAVLFALATRLSCCCCWAIPCIPSQLTSYVPASNLVSVAFTCYNKSHRVSSSSFLFVGTLASAASRQHTGEPYLTIVRSQPTHRFQSCSYLAIMTVPYNYLSVPYEIYPLP